MYRIKNDTPEIGLVCADCISMTYLLLILQLFHFEREKKIQSMALGGHREKGVSVSDPREYRLERGLRVFRCFYCLSSPSLPFVWPDPLELQNFLRKSGSEERRRGWIGIRHG